MKFPSRPSTSGAPAFLWAVALCAVASCAQGSDDYGPRDTGRDISDAAVPDVADIGGADTDPDRDAPGDDAPEYVPDPPPQCDPEMAACGVQCADLRTDPDNCGACGYTCVIPRAEAGCDDGSCALAQCDLGYDDRDGRIDNGCEAEILCEAGGPCPTMCGTSGSVQCVDDEPVCAPPAEACNAMDDNCDGACDEGGIRGCRAGVHRAHGNGHMYTTDLAAAGRAPYRVERENYFWIYQGPVPGTRPLFLCRKGDGKRFLTSDTACEMAGAPELQLGHWSPTQMCGAVPLYRLYHAPTNNHFYTLNAGERDNARDNLGYVTEGIAGWVWAAR